MASYLYYHCDESLLSDEYYDSLAVFMLKRWRDIRHPHKRLITRKDLEAGSSYALREDQYPSITKSAAHRLMRGG
ncbi:hypothetical protein GIW81_00930 [Hyphomicrobium sp. xq]|uniref:Uncharacterized protein n=1 Tax=Hyphomicrobium album TaxID=2665159 RepID=A0A6I3KGU6_9HYPH|nr:hypothetical protein [Hyphomicrobium album]MTD92892.1 hypothetical protein [Hyphomicrobium album]